MNSGHQQIGQQIIFKNDRQNESSSCPSGFRDESDKVSVEDAPDQRREQEHSPQLEGPILVDTPVRGVDLRQESHNQMPLRQSQLLDEMILSRDKDDGDGSGGSDGN